MERRQLDVKMIKANDLRDVNLLSKMDVYAIVSIPGDSNDKSTQKTPLDKEAGTSPKWNYPMKFSVDELAAQQNRLVLKIVLICDRTFGDKEIGQVHVPIKELLDGSVNRGNKSEKSLAYSLTRPSGKIKGTVEFSYKFGEKYTEAPPPYPVQKTAEGAVMAYPAGYAGTSAGGYPPASGVAPMGGYPVAAQQGYGYPYAPPQQGYGYPPAPQYGCGYGPSQAGYGYGYPPLQRPQKSKMGAGGGMALGLGAGLLGGLLVGDMISDVGDIASYDAGFGDGFDL